MAFKGIDVRQSGDRIVFRVLLQDSTGAAITSGTAAMRLYELQNDGTLKSYDFNDNTFKTTALTTATQNLTHRQGNNATVNTGIWTYSLTNVAGFTRGNIYFTSVNHSSASPTDQVREFQYGEGQGDLTIASTGEAYSDVRKWIGNAPAALSSNGYVQTMLLRWLTDNAAGTPVALSSSGYIQSILLRWLTDNAAGTPSALSTNGFLQVMMMRLLTDNAGGTPNALQSGRFDSYLGAAANNVITSSVMAADAITSSQLSSSAINEIRDSILADSTPFNGADITSIKAAVDTEVAQILTDTTTLLLRITASRAGYLDNLNIGGLVASQTEALSIQNNTRAVRSVPPVIERPDSGTFAIRIELLLYDSVGNMEAPDSAPTLDVVNQSGTSRNDHLDSTTMALVSTGRYRAIYTVQTADELEALYFTFSTVEGGATRQYGNVSMVVDTTAVDFTSADRTKLDTLAADYTTARAAKIDFLTGNVALNADIQTLLSRISANVALNSDMSTLLTRLSSARAGYLDNLSNGPAALEATLTAIKGAGWSNEGLKQIYDSVALRLLASAYTAADNATITASKTILDRLNTMIELDGLVYRYTTNSLEQSPAGSGGGASLQDILDGITADHGAGLYTSSGAAGANTVNVTIQDDEDNLIPDALVTIYASNGTTLIDQQRTSNVGIATFNLDSDDYKISVSVIPGYSSLAIQDLTVNSNPENVTYTLSSISYVIPDSASARTVYGYVRGVGIQELEGKIITARLYNEKTSSIENALLLHERRSDESDAQGLWELVLTKGSAFTRGDGKYIVEIDGEDFGPFVVPDGEGEVNITEILPFN